MESTASTNAEHDSVVAQLPHALDGARVDVIQLALAGARLGAARLRGDASTTVEELVLEIDGIETAALLELGTDDPPAVADAADAYRRVLHAARRVHALCALLRHAALAGYNCAAASTERRRARVVRHDMANAIGTVRNAVLMMASEPAADALPAPALSTAVSAAASSTDNASSNASTNASANASSPRRPPNFREIAVRNTTVLEQMIRVELSDAHVTRSAVTRTVGALFDELIAPADVRLRPDEQQALRELAAAVGVTLDIDDASGALCRVEPGAVSRADASGGNARNDLGRSRERDHLDPLGL